MNSILILNKENFYTQLNTVLEKKSDELILAKVKEEDGEKNDDGNED